MVIKIELRGNERRSGRSNKTCTKDILFKNEAWTIFSILEKCCCSVRQPFLGKFMCCAETLSAHHQWEGQGTRIQDSAGEFGYVFSADMLEFSHCVVHKPLEIWSWVVSELFPKSSILLRKYMQNMLAIGMSKQPPGSVVLFILCIMPLHTHHLIFIDFSKLNIFVIFVMGLNIYIFRRPFLAFVVAFW